MSEPAPATRTAAVRYLAGSRTLRAVFLAMLVSGIGTSIASPQLTLFLVGEVHLPLAAAGLYYLTNLAAPVAGFVIGSLSDRARSRARVYRVCALVGATGWVLMALATQPWMPFVINVLLLSVAGAGAAQLQATVRDVLTRRPTPVDGQVVAIMRIAMALGWIVGPVIGAPLGALFGLRPLLVATALGLVATTLLPLSDRGRSRDPSAAVLAAHLEPRRAASAWHPVRGSVSLRPLLLFTLVDVLVMCGETIKIAYLPIYMNDQLHLAAAVRGAVIGFQPLVEVLLMPVAALLADRWGMARVLFAGAIAAVAAHASYATAGDVAAPLVSLVAGQVAMAGAVATFGVLGITVAQRLQPDRIGLASSVFLSAFAINAAVGGSLGSLGAAVLGLPHLYWIPAALAAIGAASLLALHRAHPLDGPPRAAR